MGDLANVTEQGGVVTVRFLGETVGTQQAMAIAPDIREAMDAAGSGLRWLVLDFSPVTFLNSYGLGMCIEMRKHAEELGGQTVLAGLNKDLRDLIHVVRLESLFAIASDDAELKQITAE